MSNADELYSDTHQPDPVTEAAVAAAMAATDRPRSSFFDRFGTVLVVALLLVATLSSVMGFFNSVQISKQNSKLAHANGVLSAQSVCLTNLVHQFEIDQLNRVAISADDRDAIRDLVKKVFTSPTIAERIQAYNDFIAKSNSNDARRALIPTQLKPSCNLPGVASAATPTPQSTLPLPKTTKSAAKSAGALAPVPSARLSPASTQNFVGNSSVAVSNPAVAPAPAPVAPAQHAPAHGTPSPKPTNPKPVQPPTIPGVPANPNPIVKVLCGLPVIGVCLR